MISQDVHSMIIRNSLKLYMFGYISWTCEVSVSMLIRISCEACHSSTSLHLSKLIWVYALFRPMAFSIKPHIIKSGWALYILRDHRFNFWKFCFPFFKDQFCLSKQCRHILLHFIWVFSPRRVNMIGFLMQLSLSSWQFVHVWVYFQKWVLHCQL